MTQTVRRLPGIRFERQPPLLQEVLPRMDIAGFVGFAASGPIDVPVPIEDATEFARIFGGDAPLAWDASRGEVVYAYLAPVVRAFFRNGGRRCWIVRVADREHAASDSFAVPGLAAVDAHGALAPAVLRARSEGSWADELRVSAWLEPTPVQLRAHPLDELTFYALVASSDELVPGDLIRISFLDSPWALLFAVASIGPLHSPPSGSDQRLRELSLKGKLARWVRIAAPTPGRNGHLHYLDAHGSMQTEDATVASASSLDGDGLVRISLRPDAAGPPPRGALVRGVFARHTVWIDVANVEVAADGATTIIGTPFQVAKSSPPALRAHAPRAFAERLNLSLRVEDTSGGASVLSELGFEETHPRFAGLLPTDADLYADPASPLVPGTLKADAAVPRFPLAGPLLRPCLYLPLGASIIPGPALPALRPAGLDRQRDGLDGLDTELFLDPGLATTGVEQLLEQAFWLQYRQPVPRALRGVHALLGVDEVTIVSVPDAVQRGWYLTADTPTTTPAPPLPAAALDWSRFLDCRTHVPATPVLKQAGDGETGTFALTWRATDIAGATYELQETTAPADDAAAELLYAGPELGFSVYGRPAGLDLFYRVRAIAAGIASGWSNWIAIHTTPAKRWFLDDSSAYTAANTLVPVQLALLRMCAARGDLFAVLTLPEHYRERAAIAHTQALKASSRPPGSDPDPIFSYGALYHPWLYASDAGDPAIIGRTPPDGAAAGILAARASRRGAWVAPANEPLRDVVELDPPLGAEWYQSLQDAQVNVARHEPGGFFWLAADTLSDDEDLRPIGVRRLLQVLRRAALLHGEVYAFEANGDELRRTVQRGFEQLLARMLALGAFAGASASDAYRVVTDSSLNTPESVDAGRLIVELKVAPSRPLAFLTVRLVRTGQGSLQVETR